MSFDDITQACLLIFDTLKDDEEAQDIIELIDSAEGDDAIKEGLQKAVLRLDVINPAVAKEVREKAKGFAF